MATAKELARLFSAIAANDMALARSIALRIACAEGDRGHHMTGKLLRGSLQPNGREGSPWETTQGSHTGFLAGAFTNALSAVSTLEPLAEVVLSKRARNELATIVQEWKARQILEQKGLRRRNKLLFCGPPGCGKSLTARAMGRELGVPVFVLRFDGIVGAYLGQTAQRLRELFEFAANTDCVLLIDEIDALGKRRGHPMEVGELDRIVISLLQELEHSEPKGLLVAATNAPISLDEALWRRFDLILDFPKPTKAQLRSFVLSQVGARGVRRSSALRQALNRCSTFADAVRAIEGEQRRRILAEV